MYLKTHIHTHAYLGSQSIKYVCYYPKFPILLQCSLPLSPATADLFSDAEGWRAFSGYLPKCKYRCLSHSSFARLLSFISTVFCYAA